MTFLNIFTYNSILALEGKMDDYFNIVHLKYFCL